MNQADTMTAHLRWWAPLLFNIDGFFLSESEGFPMQAKAPPLRYWNRLRMSFGQEINSVVLPLNLSSPVA